jgi:hypothetical protein
VCNLLLAPAGAPELTVSRGPTATVLDWTPVTTATGYDLVRGVLSALGASGGNFAVATDACLASNVSGSSATDAGIPAAGDGFWYLTRARNCAGVSTYDDGSPTLAPGRDGEIAASGNGCP